MGASNYFLFEKKSSTFTLVLNMPTCLKVSTSLFKIINIRAVRGSLSELVSLSIPSLSYEITMVSWYW